MATTEELARELIRSLDGEIVRLRYRVEQLEEELAHAEHKLGHQAMPNGETWLVCRHCVHVEEVY